jgi:hypothetical protein
MMTRRARRLRSKSTGPMLSMLTMREALIFAGPGPARR